MQYAFFGRSRGRLKRIIRYTTIRRDGKDKDTGKKRICLTTTIRPSRRLSIHGLSCTCTMQGRSLPPVWSQLLHHAASLWWLVPRESDCRRMSQSSHLSSLSLLHFISSMAASNAASRPRGCLTATCCWCSRCCCSRCRQCLVRTPNCLADA